jgi:predicted nucleic acid-binding protein
MIVIADSGPIRYLVVIEQIHLLPQLYGRIVIPPSVLRELSQTATPQTVRLWVDRLPRWVTVQSTQGPLPTFPAALGPGEREAIALAQELTADVLLADDEAARMEAQRRNISPQGTLGVLDLAAEHGLLADLPAAVDAIEGHQLQGEQETI